jgi:uncharacterized protein YlxW (UPF0749 family)
MIHAYHPRPTMTDPAFKDLPEWMPASVVAVVAAFWGILKVTQSVKATQRDVVRTDAEIDILTRLREELARVSHQNEQLLSKVAELQSEVHALQTQNSQLQAALLQHMRATNSLTQAAPPDTM